MHNYIHRHYAVIGVIRLLKEWVYIQPIVKKGLTCESNLLVSSLKGDGVNMEITNEGASSAAEGRQGSFWDDSE